MSSDAEVDNNELDLSSPNHNSNVKKSFWKSLLGATNTTTNASDEKEAGMENGLISKIEKMNFRNQMKMFYTAYSKVWKDSRS